MWLIPLKKLESSGHREHVAFGVLKGDLFRQHDVNPAGGAGVARPSRISAREDRDSIETATKHLYRTMAAMEHAARDPAREVFKAAQDAAKT